MLQTFSHGEDLLRRWELLNVDLMQNTPSCFLKFEWISYVQSNAIPL